MKYLVCFVVVFIVKNSSIVCKVHVLEHTHLAKVRDELLSI